MHIVQRHHMSPEQDFRKPETGSGSPWTAAYVSGKCSLLEQQYQKYRLGTDTMETD